MLTAGAPDEAAQPSTRIDLADAIRSCDLQMTRIIHLPQSD